MLPKTNRIKKKKDFELIFKNGTSFKNKLFILRFIKNNSDQNRFGFIVSQKVSKKATVRNKTRRRLTEAVKARRKKIKPGKDFVLIALSGIEKKELSDIREALDDTLVKAKLIIGD